MEVLTNTPELLKKSAEVPVKQGYTTHAFLGSHALGMECEGVFSKWNRIVVGLTRSTMSCMLCS